MDYFEDKKAREAIERGEFVDIHDIGSDDFDVLITDVNDGLLRTEVAEVLGVPYLAKATPEEAEKRPSMSRGILYGRNLRPIFPCVVSSGSKAHWVFFIADTGSPRSYISAQVSIPTFRRIPDR
jgi:hypothetical protein